MSRFVLTAQLQLQAPNNVSQVVSQIQNQLNNISVNVRVQGSAQANQQLQQITQSTQAATTAAGRMGNAFAVSIRRFAAFSIATRAVGLFTSTLSDAVKTAIDFERELIKISQVTGRSVSSLRDLTDSVTNLSTGLGVTSQSLLEVTTVLTQAGLSSEDTKIALESLAKAALAPNFDSITETAEGAIAILAQFKQGVGALEGQLSSIDAVAGAFAVEAGDLIDVIRRSGGVFKASGGSLNELLALFTSVRATTRESAESIGTGLRTIFTRIQRPETIEFLKQFGVELVDLNGKFVGPYEAIKRLSEALSGLGEGDLTFISIAEELGGFRQIGKVLPLLQQFSTAQAALNVAQNAGNGLTKNAETAQASLAIRIIKVKEEFLALVRSMTETTTFQVMANTALALASALIKIADSIKPLLPMLAAVAGFRAIRGIGGFLGGIGAGLASGRTFSSGGRVHAFATGGLVPGTGNRDTVPAMLTPGEFVIRKSSVQKLGAGNLAHMNTGGIVQKFATGGTADKISQARNQSVTTEKKAPKDIKSIQLKLPKFATEKSVGIATSSYLPTPTNASISVDRDAIVNQSIGDLGYKLSDKYGSKESLAYIKKVYPNKTSLSYNASVEGVGEDEAAKFKTIIDESIGSAVDIASQRFASEVLGTNMSTPVPKLPSFYKTLDQGFRGQLFENVITSMAGKPLSGQDSRRPFDFTRGIGKFKNVYSNLNMDYVDAKITKSAAGVGDKGLSSKGGEGLNSKILAQLAKEAIPTISLLQRQAGEIGTLTTQGKEAEKNLSPLEKSKRASRRHFGGIIQKFAVGGLAKPKDTLERYFTDASPINLGLSNSKALSKDQRKQLASDTRDLRQLRTPAPQELYSSISRNAFDKFAMDTGLNKNPEIPAGTKLFERSKFYAKEVANIIGKSFSLPGFVSTSKNYGVAKSFLDNAPRSEDNWAAMLTIATKKNAQGVDVAEQLKDRKINVTKQDINPRTGKMDTFFMKQPNEENEFMLSPRSRFRVNTAKYVDLMGRHNLWANVQQFAAGGRAKGIEGAPLVDDIPQASGSILPRPSAAIQALIKAGGGAVDVDRTLKRTIGDTAYAKAPTPGAKDASLNTYFRDEVKRLQDLKAAPITQFGQELQAAIKNGQLDARKISIISKSKRVKGAAEYLSSQFGIPVQNMIFTQGASKQPAIDAIRNKGSRVDRVARFATGGNVGTDTVPALLTPGEFVVNKASAQRIGYGNLNRMNKVGKYAKGGVVQTFATGGTATGGTKSVVSNIPVPGFDTKAPTLLNSIVAKLTGTFSIVDIGWQKSSKDVKLLQTITPTLSKSLKDYANAANLTTKEEGQLAAAYAKIVGTMLLQGKTNAQIVAATQLYADALQKDTNAKLNAAKATVAATAGSPASASPILPKAPTPMGAPGSIPGMNNNTTAINANTQAQRSAAQSAMGVVNNNKMFVASMTTSLIQGFLPAVDENSSAVMRATQSLLSMTTVVFGTLAALEAFNISLNSKTLSGVFDLFSSGAGKGLSGLSARVGGAAGSAVLGAGGGANLAIATSTVAGALTKLIGPIGIAATTFFTIKAAGNALTEAFMNYEGRLKKATEKGDEEAARQIALDKTSSDALTNIVSATLAGEVTGAIVGFFAGGGPLGAAVGTTIGAFVGASLGAFFSGSLEYAEEFAASQATSAKAQNELAKASENATKALSDFEKGNISLTELIQSTSKASGAVRSNRQQADRLDIQSNKEISNDGILSTALRNTLTLGGLIGETTGQKQTRITEAQKQSRANVDKQERELITASQPLLNKVSEEVAISGGTFTDVLDKINASNPDLAFALLSQGTNDLSKSFGNISKEIERARSAFNAMNLGMQNVQGAASAAALGVKNYVASQQAGNIGLEQSLSVLEASITSAAQGISNSDFNMALGDVEATLRKFGASDEQINKFKTSLKAVNEIQKNQASIFDSAKEKLATNIRNSVGAEGRRTAFTQAIEEQLNAAGYNKTQEGRNTIQRIKDATANMSDDQLKEIGNNNFSVFEETIKGLGKTILDQANGPIKESIEIQQELNNLTKQRIDAERQLINAQLEVSNVRMEAMDIAAKYGGPKVTPQMRAQNIVQQANIQATGIQGVTELKTGSAKELSERTKQLQQRQDEISKIRQRAANKDALKNDPAAAQRIQGEDGKKLDEEEKRIQEAARSQIQATRDLIKAKEEELRLIKEKNQLEKSSIDALVSGDIEKFFDQQAAVGAQAAIATGDQRLIGQFGMGALGAAAQETRRQQDAGVTSMFGQNLGGPDGLTERAFGAAISSAGIQNPLAMAQVAAGTTGAEAAAESDIRDLAGTMVPTADIQVKAANDQLLAAQMQLDAAMLEGQDAINLSEIRNQKFASGGLVYASAGKYINFQPRGTDTIPAMLTPGEFVVRREAVQRDNNLSILQAMNRGTSSSSTQSGGVATMATGGMVRYREDGSTQPEKGGGGFGFNLESLGKFAEALTNFNTKLAENITNLANTKFEITLNPTNVNVNLTGASLLKDLTDTVQSKIFEYVGQEISTYRVGNGGKLEKSDSVLGK